MKNTNKKLATFLQNNPNTTKTSIGEHLKMAGLPLFNLLKAQVKEGVIIATGAGSDITYSLPETKDEAVEQQAVLTISSTDTETKDTPSVAVQPVMKKATIRDNSTFKLDGADLNKGALARAIISKFVADQNPSYSQLKTTFPDTLLKKYGVVQDEKTAREISGEKYDRYFFKTEHAIKLKDKKTVVVCNQWTLDNIQPLIKVAKELGYKIK